MNELTKNLFPRLVLSLTLSGMHREREKKRGRRGNEVWRTGKMGSNVKIIGF